MNYQLHFVFLFQPLNFIEEPERSVLQNRLLDAVVPSYFSLNALQRKHRWIFEVPHGTFSNDFQGVTSDDERAAREHIFNGMTPRLFRTRDIVQREGITYYQRNVLERILDVVQGPAQRAMFHALLACMDAAERDPTLVKGIPSRPKLSPDQRRNLFGHSHARGAAWTPEEDAVIRRWFGRRSVGEHLGKHAPLTKEQWDYVLADLKGIRSKNSVQQRINALNARLLTELLRRQQAFYKTTRVECLRRAWVPEYMDRVLGEKPRLPPTRTR